MTAVRCVVAWLEQKPGSTRPFVDPWLTLWKCDPNTLPTTLPPPWKLDFSSWISRVKLLGNLWSCRALAPFAQSCCHTPAAATSNSSVFIHIWWASLKPNRGNTLAFWHPLWFAIYSPLSLACPETENMRLAESTGTRPLFQWPFGLMPPQAFVNACKFEFEQEVEGSLRFTTFSKFALCCGLCW